MPKYDEIKRKLETRIAALNTEEDDTQKEITQLERQIGQHEANKKSGKNYKEKDHAEAKKEKILLEGTLKRIGRDLALVQKQLKDLKDGFERDEGRRQNDKDVEEHAKTYLFEVKKHALKVGDTSAKLKKDYDTIVAKRAAQMDKVSQILDALPKHQDNEAMMKKLNEANRKESALLTALQKQEELYKERLEYYEAQKKQLKAMLADNRITDAEYKIFKQSLKNELR